MFASWRGICKSDDLVSSWVRIGTGSDEYHYAEIAFVSRTKENERRQFMCKGKGALGEMKA